MYVTLNVDVRWQGAVIWSPSCWRPQQSWLYRERWHHCTQQLDLQWGWLLVCTHRHKKIYDTFVQRSLAIQLFYRTSPGTHPPCGLRGQKDTRSLRERSRNCSVVEWNVRSMQAILGMASIFMSHHLKDCIAEAGCHVTTPASLPPTLCVSVCASVRVPSYTCVCACACACACACVCPCEGERGKVTWYARFGHTRKQNRLSDKQDILKRLSHRLAAVGVLLLLRVVLIRIPKRNRNRGRISHTSCVTMCDICDSHKMSQFRICDLVCFSDFFWIFDSETDLVTCWSQMVTHSNVTGTNLVLFLFSRKWFGINEIQQNIPVTSVSVFCPDQNGSHLQPFFVCLWHLRIAQNHIRSLPNRRLAKSLEQAPVWSCQ